VNNYWDSLALQFQHQGPPLRPCPEDIQTMRGLVLEWSSRHPRPWTNILLLGVTPEIATLPWPPGTRLLAVEKSQPMIDIVWPGDIPDQRQVICANWFDLRNQEGAFDIVIGDGFLTSMAYPDQYVQISRQASQWLKTDGLLILRAFARPEKKETLKDILADLTANAVPTFDTLKWRLAMAIQNDTARGVAVADIYRAWLDIEIQYPSLPERAGWLRANVDTIKLYDGRPDIYTFPTVNELNQALSVHLEQVSATFPKYPFGNNCPILTYRRKVTAPPH
jgi:hypothetical protein